MIRTFLTTTALAALMTTGALAQSTTTPAAPAAPAQTTAAPAAAPNASILASGYVSTNTDNLATNIIGQQVYSSAAADAEHIGNVNNLVVNEGGDIAAVIIGVGGFLGLGEKNVAVNYSELQWVVAADNTKRFVLNTTKEALEAAPTFEAVDSGVPADNAMAPAAPVDNNAMAPAAPVDNNAMAPATPAAPADNNAMAPAAPATPMATAPATGPIDRGALTDDTTLTAEELIGTNAYGPADEHLGAIGDVVLGSDGTTVEAVIIDFGGFLGIGTKPVAVDINNLRFATDTNNNRYLFINVTRDQLDAAPAFNRDTFAAERDNQLLRTTAM